MRIPSHARHEPQVAHHGPADPGANRVGVGPQHGAYLCAVGTVLGDGEALGRRDHRGVIVQIGAIVAGLVVAGALLPQVDSL